MVSGARKYAATAFTAALIFTGKTEVAQAQAPIDAAIAPTFFAYNCNPNLLTVESLNRAFYTDATINDSLMLGKAMIAASKDEESREIVSACMFGAVMVYSGLHGKIQRVKCRTSYDEHTLKNATPQEKQFIDYSRELSDGYLEVAKWLDDNGKREYATNALKGALHHSIGESSCYHPAAQKSRNIWGNLERRLAPSRK